MLNLIELVNYAKKENIWSLGNITLYKLCDQYPNHINEKEIIAKIWLIGRSYAAAIERRKIKDDIINENYYKDKVIPEILKSSIDTDLYELKLDNSKDNILKTHKKVMDVFKKISGQEKRSLASKYLHFHQSSNFYIFDTRAVSAVNKLCKKLEIKSGHQENNPEYDKAYTNYYEKCEKIVNLIKDKTNVKLSPRELDNILLGLSNNEI